MIFSLVGHCIIYESTSVVISDMINIEYTFSILLQMAQHFLRRATRSSLKRFIPQPSYAPRSGRLRMQKLKSHLVRIQSLNVLPFTPGVGQYIVIHATLNARDFFFLAYFYTSGPFTCIFSKTSPDFSLCWLWLTHGSCVGPQNKIGHPAGCRFPC